MPALRAILPACLIACAWSGLSPARAASFDIVYTFKGGTDGASPASSLTLRGDRLFGTTSAGGNTGCQNGAGCGIAYAIDLRTGSETILHVFTGGTDGGTPTAGLTWFSGLLYGATEVGGSAGYGAVFSMDPVTGSETVLYNADGGNGNGPSADLNVHGHQLFGTTFSGGQHNAGLVFEVDPANAAFRDVHDFGGSPDAAFPLGGLIFGPGVAYGTSVEGGSDKDGTVFAVDTASGRERVLHSFGGSAASPPDGRLPIGGLVMLDGQLYGTTRFGGAGVSTTDPDCAQGCGTVFRVDAKTGAEAVIYSFTGGADGGWPSTGLTVANGRLYGTGLIGGSTGFGVVFEINPHRGTERVLHNFSIYTNFGPPGAPSTSAGEPAGAMLYHGGYLYGTTLVGGQSSSGDGYGTVFRLHP